MKIPRGALAAMLFAVAAPSARAAQGAESAEKPPLSRIEALLAKRPEKFDAIREKAAELRVQVLLGEIRDKDGRPELVQSGWRVDAEYFYPASAVKLIAAAAALEQLNAQRRSEAPKLDVDTPLAFHPVFKDEVLEAADESNLEGGVITLRHLIRKALIVSDNHAFNRLYDFCGQEWLNQRAWRAGLSSVKISHRLAVQRSQIDNKRTGAIEARFPDGPVLIGARWSNVGELGVVGPKSVYVGRAHRDRGADINKPMSFFYKNYVALEDLQRAVVRIVRPDIRLKGEPFDLTDEQRALMMDAMSTLPGDSKNPAWDREKFPDDYAKFFLPGVVRVIGAENARVYSKCGLAYGFVTDTAYIVDASTGSGFFLAATIYANSDEVIGDDQYDYETVAFPFFADLAEAAAREVWGK